MRSSERSNVLSSLSSSLLLVLSFVQFCAASGPRGTMARSTHRAALRAPMTLSPDAPLRRVSSRPVSSLSSSFQGYATPRSCPPTLHCIACLTHNTLPGSHSARIGCSFGGPPSAPKFDPEDEPVVRPRPARVSVGRQGFPWPGLSCHVSRGDAPLAETKHPERQPTRNPLAAHRGPVGGRSCRLQRFPPSSPLLSSPPSFLRLFPDEEARRPASTRR